MSRRPARETILFAVALVALATLGGVGAASIASGAPDAGAAATADLSSDGATSSDRSATASAAASAPNGSFDYDGERVVVEQAVDQRISGSTTLENGSQVTIRVRSSGGASPFLRSSVATVQPDGSFAATFDFEEIDRGTEFTVTARYNGTELASAPGVVGGCEPSCGEPAGDAEFAKKIYQGTAGDAVEIQVQMTNRDTATVVFGSEATNVRIPVTVEDGNGDGTVVLQVQTAVDAPNEHGMSAKAEADEVSVPRDVERPDELAAGQYTVSLFLDTQSDPVEVDVGTVVLSEPTDDPATTRGGGSTTAGTIYGSASTSTPGGDGGVSMETIGILAVGGVLAIVGVAALVGGFD